MTQPFVVSLKITGDSQGATTAARETKRELEALQRTANQLTAGGPQGRLDDMLGIGSSRRGTEAARADIEAYGRELDTLRARFNPLFAAQQRFEAASQEISRAQRVGALSAAEAASALQREEAAYRSATQAMQANTIAANDNRIARIAGGGGANQFATANVAAQFQDIFVQGSMPGVAWQMVALQQGTQLSAALGGQGLTGVVRTLGAAFASVLSPVSLLTIAAVGLATVGVQAFVGTMNATEDATDALEEHEKWLDRTLIGWAAAREAAQGAVDAALKMPQGVVESDLRANLREQEAAAKAIEAEVIRVRNGLAETVVYLNQVRTGVARGVTSAAYEEGLRQIEFLRDLGISANSTRAELDAAMVTTRDLYNTVDDSSIRDMANEVYELAMRLRAVQSEAASATAALAALNAQALADIATSTDRAFSAIERLRRSAPDLRTAHERALDDLNEAMGEAPDGIIRLAAQRQYDRTIAALDEQERRAEALKAGRGGANDFDQWGGAQANFAQRTEQMRMEIALLGQSTYEAARQRAAFDLLNQAKQAGIPITGDVIGLIHQMAAEHAGATVELERATLAQRRLDEATSFYRATFNSLFMDMKSGLREGLTSWEALGNAGANALDKIADRALGMAANGIFDMIFGAVMGGLGGGFGVIGGGGGVGIPAGGFVPGLTGPRLFDTGGWTGGANPARIAGLVHEQEFVVKGLRHAIARNSRR